MPIAKFTDPIYRITINFICFEVKERVIKFLKKETGNDYTDLIEKSGGFFVGAQNNKNSENFNFYLVLMESSTHRWEAILAHEALHITSRALRVRGFVLSDDSEEAFTYFLAYIIEQCATFYKKHMRKKKK